MSNLVVTSPQRPYTFLDKFKAVSNGEVYAGIVDKTDLEDPANQIQVYVVQEDGTEVPVSQPLKINSGGLLVYSGQPSKFVVKSNYSMLVKQRGKQVFYEPNMAFVDPESAVFYANKGDSLVSGGLILPIENRGINNGEDVSNASFIKVLGGDFANIEIMKILGFSGSGNIDSLNLTPPYTATISGNVYQLAINKYFSFNDLNIKAFGAKGDGVTDDTAAFKAAVSYAKGNGLPLALGGNVYISDMVYMSGTVHFDSQGFQIVALPSFNSSAEAIVKFGNDFTDSARGNIKSIRVDCSGLNNTGILFGHTSDLRCEYAEVNNHNGHGIWHKSGYQLFIRWITRSVDTPLTGTLPDIDKSTNVGLLSTTSDSVYSEGSSIGCDVGVITSVGNVSVIDCHPWSTYTTGKRKMRACFVDGGENNTYTNCFADSPCVIDYNADASRTNGGYGFYLTPDGDAFGNKYTNCTCFIPTISPEIGSVPENRLVGAYISRARTQWNNFITLDRTGKAMLSEKLGSFNTQCDFNSRQQRQHWNGLTGDGAGTHETFGSDSRQYEFTSRLHCSRGLTFAVKYTQESDVPMAWGQCTHTADGQYYTVTYNDEGVTRNINLEKESKGTTQQRDFLNLTTDDAGYKWFNTSTGKYNVWNGTKWTDMSGADL